MSNEEPRGGPHDAFLGVSRALYKAGGETGDTLDKPATFEAALHDAAQHAAAGGYAEKDLRVVHIEFKPTRNPHIKELRVIVTPV